MSTPGQIRRGSAVGEQTRSTRRSLLDGVGLGLGLGLGLALTTGCQTPSTPPPVVPVESAVAPVPVPAPAPAPTIVDLELQSGWGCALLSDGSVQCWGAEDRAGHLRPDEPRWEVAGVLEGVTDVVDIATSDRWLCAAFQAGGVRCWGPYVSPLGKFEHAVQVAVGDFVCARSKEGLVGCADPADPTDHPYFPHLVREYGDGLDDNVRLDKVIDISVHNGGAALDQSGVVWQWGFNRNAKTDPNTLHGVPEVETLYARRLRIRGALDGAKVLVGADERICLLRAGAVWCSNKYYGEDFTRLPGLDHVNAFSSAGPSNCAIHATGDVTCGGDNSWAQLGDGTSSVRTERIHIEGLEHTKLLATSRSSACAATDREIHCWGTRSTLLPREQHRLTIDATGIAADGDVTCASTIDAGLLCWGTSDRDHFLGSDVEGILGVAQPRPVALEIGPLKKMQGGCLLAQAGDLVCGHFGEPEHPSPSVGAGSFVVQHRQRAVTDFCDTGAARCSISRGVLSCVASVDGRPVRHLPKFRRPTALTGTDHAVCVLHGAGEITCFAVVENGRRLEAQSVKRVGELTGIKSMTEGDDYGVHQSIGALDARGVLWTWTLYYHRGKFRVGSPERRSGTADDIVYAGHGLCVRDGDQLSCDKALLYDQSSYALADVVDLAGGANHVCARHEDGTVSCLGSNSVGQLGSAPATVMRSPVAIELAR